ncbi:DUF4433 domain-containing protein [Pseudomonas oryzihabitans]|uniref:DUF4433 domain-containing protein n=1 Tax=Pseudomonas oryzihabitans TaxID=47885 RepID=UPI002095D1B5|nr:DUF4433 domain-containing protein [Pseudomonas psychrotolerans]
MAVPAQPKIYHICHVDRLPSIIASAGLLSDAVLLNQALPGTVIGMNHIKQRRLQLELDSHPGLHVGECVPFYFCPRSVMLFLISRAIKTSPTTAAKGLSCICRLTCMRPYSGLMPKPDAGHSHCPMQVRTTSRIVQIWRN